jgi:hypothetical protein
MTRSRVSGAIGTLVGAPLSTRDTVLWDTSATAAMSRIVTAGRRPGGRTAVTISPGASSAVDSGLRLLVGIPARLA